MDLKEDFNFHYINWKIPFYSGILISIITLYALIEAKDYFINIINNDIFKNMYNLFVFLLVFNMGLATYTVSLYHYRIVKPGMKGPKGIYGKHGKHGNDTKCDLFSPKHRTFSPDQTVELEPYDVDTKKIDDLNKYTIDVDNISYPKWTRMYTNKDDFIKNKQFLGTKFTSCLRDGKCEKVENQNASQDSENNNNYRPFSGAFVNYNLTSDNTDGNINSLQFTYNEGDASLYNQELVGERLGTTDNSNTSDNFKCPANSAIYKIETLYDNDKKNGDNTDYGTIKGMTFYCRDKDTGNPTKILDSNNNEVESVSFGVTPTPNNNKYSYKSVECGNNMHYGKSVPGFISNYSSVHSKDDGINTLVVNQCSYYNDLKEQI